MSHPRLRFKSASLAWWLILALWSGSFTDGKLHPGVSGDPGDNFRGAVSAEAGPCFAMGPSADLVEDPPELDLEGRYLRQYLGHQAPTVGKHERRNDDATIKKRLALLHNHLIGLPPPHRA